MEQPSASAQIDAIVEKAGDWRGATLARLRALVSQAAPAVVEEVKWKEAVQTGGSAGLVGEGIVCVADTLKNAVRLTFPKGAELNDPKHLFSSRLESKTVRAIDFREGEAIDETVLAALVAEAVVLNTAL
jgi:hypothetical protein